MKPSTPRRRRRPAVRRPWLEILEDRTLPSLGVPLSIDPSAAAQALFGPDLTQQTILHNLQPPPGSDKRLFRFALDGPAFNTSVQINIAPAGPNPNPVLDASLGLFDADGNRIAFADQDSKGQKGVESLGALVESGKVYELGVFFDPSGPLQDFTLTVAPGPQDLNPRLRINPQTGAAVRQGAFSSPADVEYYPLDLTNGAASGNVTVTPTDPGEQVFATLFRRASPQDPWQAIDSGTANGPVALTPTPPAGGNLTDAQYLLAITTRDFASAARTYRIDVATTTLGTGTVDPAQATALPTPAPVALGTAEVDTGGSFNGMPALYRFRAPAVGNATLTLDTSSQQSILGVYDAAGNLLSQGVTTHQGPGPINLTMSVNAGQDYLVRAADTGDLGGGYTLKITTPYVPEDLPFDPDNTATRTGIQVGPGQGGRFYRLNPAAGTDVLAVQVTPGTGNDPIAPKVVLVDSQGILAQSPPLAAGATLFLPVKVSGVLGPIDLYIAGTSGSDPADLKVGQLQVATELTLKQLTGAEIDLHGQLGPITQDPGSFGNQSGIAYYQLLTDPNDPNPNTTLTVQGTGGTQPVLAHYTEAGGIFHLVDFQLPNDQGTAQLAEPLTGYRYQGVAAFSLDFDGSPSPQKQFQFSVAGPVPSGVGVGMVPNVPPPLPNTPPPPPPPEGYQSLLNISNVSLDTDFQQYLWKTTLPYNLVYDASRLPAVKFTPPGPHGSLRAHVSVYDAANLATPLQQGINTLYQSLTLTLAHTAAEVDALRGHTLLFRVEVVPVPGALGDGKYSLGMTVATSDPNPFLVIQTAWKFPNTTPNYVGGDGQEPGVIPKPIVDIVQNQLGQGSAQGEFQTATSAEAANFDAKTVDIYRFWAFTPGPVSVRTVSIDGKNVNTNIRLYRARYDGSHNLEYLGQLTNTTADGTTETVGPNFDWFPADRSTIDAQVYVNDFNLLKYDEKDDTNTNYFPSGEYFAVVRNQEGSAGKYRIDVNTAPFPLRDGVNPGNNDPNPYFPATNGKVAYLPVTGGSLTFTLNDINLYHGFAGYYPVQVPPQHNGTLTVLSDTENVSKGPWQFDLFDASGRPLSGNNQAVTHPNGKASLGTFTIPDGPQTVYLRVERVADEAANPVTHLTLSTQVTPGPVGPPPGGIFPATAAPLFSTNPFGSDASPVGESLGPGGAATYGFRAAPGPLTVQVQPGTTSGLVRWGVYQLVGNGMTLLCWGVSTAGTPATTFALPGLRQPLTSMDFAYDRAPYSNLLLRVENLHEQSVQFGVQLTSASARPMRDGTLAIDPLTGNSQTALNVTGFDWQLLSIPAHSSGPVELDVSPTSLPPFPGSTTIHFDLYDTAGNYVDSGTAFAGLFFPTCKFSVAKALGGQSYYLRVGVLDEATATVNVSAKVSLPKAGAAFAKPPATELPNLFSYPLSPADPTPDGIFTASPGATTLVTFWVGQGGLATFGVTPNNDPNPYVALYRADVTVKNQEITPHYDLTLVDYENLADNDLFQHLAFTAYLEPGLYALQVMNTSGANIFAHLPADPVEEIVLDPNFGDSNSPGLRAADRADAGAKIVQDFGQHTALLESFRTRVFHVVAPPGSQDHLIANAFSLDYEAASPENGTASLAVWTRPDSNSPYGTPASDPKVPDQVLDGPNTPNPLTDFTPGQASAKDAPPGSEFWISFNRHALGGSAKVTAKFDVPVSGMADLTVPQLDLLPDNGQTRVVVTAENRGFAPAKDTSSLYEFSDASQSPIKWTQALKNQQSLWPFTGQTWTPEWQPKTREDQVHFVTDYVKGNANGNVPESNEKNNEARITLKQKDHNAPTVTGLTLGTPSMNLATDPNTWGRFVADNPNDNPIFSGGPHSDIVVSIHDPDGNLLAAVGDLPRTGHAAQTGVPFTFNAQANATDATFTVPDFHFWDLLPTNGFNNPNLIHVQAVDTYGLKSDVLLQHIQVIPHPSWVTDFRWDEPNRKYQLGFHQSLINFEESTYQLVGASQADDVPVLGKLDNLFVIRMDAGADLSLNPSEGSNGAISARAELKVAGQDVFNYQFDGSYSPDDHLNFDLKLAVDGQTLDPILKFTVHFINYQIYHYQSQEIPIYSYGINGVADLNINVSFAIDVTFDAAVSIGIEVDSQGHPTLGLMAPTFIKPQATVHGNVSGEAEVLHFPLAKVTGSVDLSLIPEIGLDAPDNHLVSLQQIFGDPPQSILQNTAFRVQGGIGVSFEADILWWTVWSFSPPEITFDIASIANTPGAPLESLMLNPWPVNPPQPTSLIGDSPVGVYKLDPQPNLVIDPVTGDALYVQVDTTPGPQGPHGNLVFARRTGGVWAAATPIPQPEQVSNPALALTHDQAGAPAVVVYAAMKPPADPTKQIGDMTINQVLTGQEIRSRYFDGTSWHDEQPLTADSLYDSSPVVSFNSSGLGVTAWTHNANTTPMTDNLDSQSNEIEVAVWDPNTHSWLPPQILTSLSADSQPSVFAAEDGMLYLAWLRQVNSATVPMYSIYTGGTWSAPAQLATEGLPTGGVIRSLALGSEAPGRMNVLMADVCKQADGTSASVLYNRPSTSADFTSPAIVETVAQGTSFSFLHTVPDPQGGLIVYWQANNGLTDNVYSALLGPTPGSAWSRPQRLTSSDQLEFTPSLAIDTDGTYQVVYHAVSPATTSFSPPPPPAPPPDHPVGIPGIDGVGTSSVRLLPELGFTQPLSFPQHEPVFVNHQTLGNGAVSGTQLEARAQIVNRGPVGTPVLIEYFDGDPNQGGVIVDSQKIFLGAGNTYDLKHNFLVHPGKATYAVRLSTPGGQEVIGTSDNVSTAVLQGGPDLTVTGVTLSDANPVEGETVQVKVAVANLSDQKIKPFAVALTQGDPALANQGYTVTPIGTKVVAGLPAGGKTVVSFPWTVPHAAGDITLVAIADSGHVIAEANEQNNQGSTDVTVRPDAALVPTGGGTLPVTASILNYSGHHNVKVAVNVSNLGNANLQNVPVKLFWSYDGGPFQFAGLGTLPPLKAHSQLPFTFTTDGLAGPNRYRVVIDPQDTLPDANRGNNVAETDLVIEGLPDLVVQKITLNPSGILTQGQQLTAQAVIGNVDIGPARQIDVDVFAGDPDNGGLLIGHTVLDYLAPLSSAEADLPLDTSQLIGSQALYVIVDRFDRILETSDLNNKASVRATFRAQDRLPPVSTVNRLPAVAGTPDFVVQWHGQDAPQPGGSGIAYYDIFAAVDGGRFSLWQHTAATSAIYHGQEGHRYAFYSVATDYAGNREATPSGTQATTLIPAPAAEIHGTVYNDANANRQRNTGEAGLAGWTVYLDLNHDGRLDEGDPVTTSDASGAYSFTGLPAGTYTVMEVPPAGWFETSPGTPATAEPDPSHFLQRTGPGMHYAWVNHGLVQGNTITIWYDFRPIGTYANKITPGQMLAAEQALQAWSGASLGRLRFVRNTTAPVSDIINIGVGNMAAVGGVSGGALLSRGGATPGSASSRTLSDGIVWLDSAQTWDTSGAATLPPRTYSAVAAFAHELGLALGLRESSDRTTSDIMYGFYSGPFTTLSVGDRADIQALYPVVPPTLDKPISLTITLPPRRVVTGAEFGNFQPTHFVGAARTRLTPGS
jgi:hypothetical protein